VFVIGCGTVGLLTIAALRETGFEGEITAAARYPHQREHAKNLGADTLIAAPRATAERYALWGQALGAECHRAELGKPTVLGGADVIFDCVASSQSIDDAMRFTAAGGRLVLVGMPAIPRGVDWTPLWYSEISLLTSYAYGVEQVNGRKIRTFELALEHLAGPLGEKLRALVGEPFPLENWREALRTAMSTGASGTVKTVFRCP
jgi:threonine dehydrogenase-like Zn-dependent dehydrogenase